MDLFKIINQKLHTWAFICVLPVILWGCAETLPPVNGTGGDSEFSQFDYDAADPIRGGKLYDKWWTTQSSFNTAPTQANPIWEYRAKDPTTNGYYNNSSDGAQWRCKECHGWDYKGASGAYGDTTNSHYTGIRGINNFNPAFTPEHVFNWIADGTASTVAGTQGLTLDHKFLADGFLSKSDVYDLTKFIFEYARNNSASPLVGDVNNGKNIFLSRTTLYDPNRIDCNSAGCHNADLPNIIDVAQNNPEEFFHKVRFGQPGKLMPAGLSIAEAQDVRAYVANGAIDPSTPPASNFDATIYSQQTTADVINGGLLYDKWWNAATTATEPSTAHPRWPATNTQITGSGTWRCKECHGWDYRGKDGAYSSGKHFTGYAGIVATTQTPMTRTTAEAIYAYLSTDTSHGFANQFFTDDEYYDLTKFVMTMRTEAFSNAASFNFIDDSTKMAIGADNANGKTLFEGTDAGCSACHGVDGKTIDFGTNEFVHDIAQSNPWEFIHKVRFGQPASAMQGLYDPTTAVGALQAAVDMLGHSQTNLVTNIKRAGLLYDKWWATDGALSASPPEGRNPIWAAIPAAEQDATVLSDSSTWRCKECHGWDYLGVNGRYADTNSKHYSGIRGFVPLSLSKTKEVLVAAISDGTCVGCTAEGHSFSQYLSADDISLLADFILNMASEADYQAALSSTDTAGGQVLYQSDTPGHCEACHGASGTSIPAVDVAAIANDNPQEFIHKSRYGHPGSDMVPPNLGFLGLNLSEAGQVLAYSKTLSTPGPTPNPSYENADMVRGGLIYDKWWKVMESSGETVQAPTGIQPFYQEGIDRGTVAPLAAGKESTSWRCKGCHAWNYKGIGYFTGTPSETGADNLLYKIDLRRQAFNNDESLVQQHFFDWIKSGYGSTTHQFGVQTPDNPTPMTDQYIWDVVKFLLDGGLTNTDTYILSSGIVIGTDTVNGEGLYNGSGSNTSVNCSVCHGADGDTPPTATQGGTGDPLDIFAIAAANDNPWEVVHKVRFGQPATPMPAIEGIPGLTLIDAYDILGYMQKRFNERQTIQQISKGSQN